MSYNIKAGTNLKYTDETGSYYFYEGDRVICYVGDKVYNGTLSLIGIYKDNTNSEPQQIICVDTYKNKTSMSRDMIKVEDITYISKNPFYDNERTYSTEQNILDTLTNKGYSAEQAKAIRDRMNDTSMFYFIPYTKASTYAIEAVKNMTSYPDNKKDIIMDLAKQCTEEAQREYFELIEIYAKEIEQCDRDTACLTDTLEIVSKCWNDLEKQKTDKAANV